MQTLGLGLKLGLRLRLRLWLCPLIRLIFRLEGEGVNFDYELVYLN